MCSLFLGMGSSLPSSKLLQDLTPSLPCLTCASLILHALGLEPHAFDDGGLIWMVVGVVRLGVGAPCLGGGLSSLLACLFLVWLSHLATKLGLRPPWV